MSTEVIQHQKNTQLKESTRERIIGMRLAGVKPSKIALILGIPVQTVYSLLRRHKNRGHSRVLPRSGRPQKLTERNKRTIILYAQEDRFATAAEIREKSQAATSKKTVVKVLHQANLNSRIARCKPLLKPIHISNRLEWAKDKKDWTMEEWRRIIWTDESSVEIGRSSRVMRVWRRSNEEFHHSCIRPTFKSGRTSVMIWGAIAHGRLGPLYIFPEGRIGSEAYIGNVLDGLLFDFYWSLSEERGYMKFMEDGAPIHNTLMERQWVKDNDIDRLDWCANSPDLNPIEHIWKYLKGQISNRMKIRKNREELISLIKEEWNRIDEKGINNLVESMPDRVQAVINKNGGHTKY